MWNLQASAVAAVALLLGGHYSGYIRIPVLEGKSANDEVERWSCRPFLPNLFSETPPSQDHPAIRDAVKSVDIFFAKRFSKGDIDSLSVAVVTSTATLYEKNFGMMRGNETETSPPTNSHSMYRIASVSKLFTALEGLVLEQKGIISW